MTWCSSPSSDNPNTIWNAQTAASIGLYRQCLSIGMVLSFVLERKVPLTCIVTKGLIHWILAWEDLPLLWDKVTTKEIQYYQLRQPKTFAHVEDTTR